MILSKLTTANNLDEMAAAEMSASETIRNSDEVFVTVSEEMFDGSEYAFVAIATNYCTVRYRSLVEGTGRESEIGGRWRSQPRMRAVSATASLTRGIDARTIPGAVASHAPPT